MPGFRISPEQQPIDELYASLDSLSFLAGRKPIGDSAGIVADVLPRLDRRPKLTLSVSGGFPSSLWDAAMEAHLPGFDPSTSLRPSGSDAPQLWGQDHLEAGEVGGRTRLLVPRRLFEGRQSDGGLFEPLLDSLSDARYARSKLAWEGGDLMAINPPAAPGRTMLIHGLAAKRYWGDRLTRAEYAWVLRTELGADSSLDVGGLAPHADYVVAFLPGSPVAIVAEPRFLDHKTASAAAAFLEALLGDAAPPAVRDLFAWIRERGPALFNDPAALRQRIAAARAQQALLELSPPPGLEADLNAYMAEHCTSGPEDCFWGSGKLQMLQTAPELLRRSLDAAAHAKLAAQYLPRILNLIEGQLPGVSGKDPRAYDAVAAELTKLGYRVVRLPFFTAAPAGEGEDPWPGVSYVNLLAIDDRIFLPSLGLGEAEQAIAAELSTTLGSAFRVELVDARAALASNGGVHCVFATIRRPKPDYSGRGSSSSGGANSGFQRTGPPPGSSTLYPVPNAGLGSK